MIEADLLWKAAQPKEIGGYVGVIPANREDFNELYKAIRETILEENVIIKE